MDDCCESSLSVAGMYKTNANLAAAFGIWRHMEDATWSSSSSQQQDDSGASCAGSVTPDVGQS